MGAATPVVDACTVIKIGPPADQRVDQQMALGLDLLAAVIPALGTTHLGALDRLTVDAHALGVGLTSHVHGICVRKQLFICAWSSSRHGKYHNHHLHAWMAANRPHWRIEVKTRPEGSKGFTPWRNAGWWNGQTPGTVVTEETVKTMNEAHIQYGHDSN